MPYLLDSNPSSSEISEALNYLLCNFDTSISSDANTGEVKGPTGGIVGYLYKYMAIKYADSFDGSVNFSNSPSGRSYFGIRNSNDASESSNYTDYIWNKVTGGFGTTKSLWYITTGGRQIQFSVSVASPGTGWVMDAGASIDLDVVTSGTSTTIAQAFVSYFSPSVLQVPRTGSPLNPVFTGITPALYATNSGVIVPFTSAQTDTNVAFVNNSWRIGNSATTGNGDISYTNITIGSPTDAGDYALWPTPTAMSSSPAYITVPIRFKNSTGVVTQASVSGIQLVFSDPGAQGSTGATGATGAEGSKAITISAFQWATSAPSVPTQAFTYTWSSGAISAYPSGWTSAATSAPGTGYVLYQLNVIITALASATSTATNWNVGTIGSIGYRQDGSIGPQGNNARLMYGKVTSGTTFTGTETTTGSTSYPDTGSHFGVSGVTWQASPPTLSVNESLFQSDGIYTTGGNTLWQTPYLSNLKVGSLSAISANLGVVNISTAGNLNSGKTSFADTTAGFFLGNDSGTPRLSIGNSSSSFTWDGSALAVNGGSFTSGVLQTATSGARIVISNSDNSIKIYNASGLAATLYGSASDGVISSAASGSVAAILGIQTSTYPAIYGYTIGTNSSQNAIYGTSYGVGVKGISSTGAEGVFGIANVAGGGNHGVRGQNLNGAGTGLVTSGIIGVSIGYDFYADGAGTNYGPFTGAHDGLLPVGQTVEIGDILVDVKCVIKKNLSNTVFEVAQSTQPQQVGIIGVLVVNNGLLANSKPAAFIERLDVDTSGSPPQYQTVQVMYPEYDLVKNDYQYIAMNAVGEGQINVCGENGNIAVGDFICSSSIPGKGMKQNASTIMNYTVARAREPITFDNPSEVKMVACIYVSG